MSDQSILLLPEANVFRDYGAPTFYKLLTPDSFITCMTPGYLNTLVNTGGEPSTQCLQEGDFLTVHPDGYPPFTVPQDNYAYNQSLLSGGIPGRVLYNASSGDLSWVPIGVGAGIKEFAFGGMRLDTYLLPNPTQAIFIPLGRAVIAAGALATDLGTDPNWGTNHTGEVKVLDDGGPLASFIMDTANLKCIKAASCSTVMTSTQTYLTAEVAAGMPAGVSITLYMWSIGFALPVPGGG